MSRRRLTDEETRPVMLAAVRCTMCAKPARIINGSPTRYCKGYQCDNRYRICQKCNETFTPGVNGAKSKYCGECTVLQESRTYSEKLKNVEICAVCITTRGRSGAHRGIWPYVCQPCLKTIRHVENRLRAHHVPWDMVRRLFQDSRCPVCKSEILEPTGGTFNSNSYRARAQLVVDHDHACCSTTTNSCGKCVRGLICHRCNTALGLLRENIITVTNLSIYISNWNQPPDA